VGGRQRTVCHWRGQYPGVARQPADGGDELAGLWTRAEVEGGHSSGTALLERELANAVGGGLLSSHPAALSARLPGQGGAVGLCAAQRTPERVGVCAMGAEPTQHARTNSTAGLVPGRWPLRQ